MSPSLRDVWLLVLPMAAAMLLAAVFAPATLAQQHETAAAGAAPHTAPSSDNRAGRFLAPQLKMAPAREPAIVHGGAAVERNAIGMSVARPDGGQRPLGLNLGRAPTVAPPASPLPSGAAVGLGGRSVPPPRTAAPAPRPLVVSRGTINGATFTRPGTAPVPLGGPAKRTASGINGTSFRPKP
jgi:hypothetical protein